MVLDLTDPQHAYMFGFLQADGSLSSGPGRKGKLRVELGIRDAAILDQFAAMVPYYSSIRTRQRTTNFKSQYRSAIWTVNALAFRMELTDLGFISGRKAERIEIPAVPFSEADYFRGIVDADGSLGLTGHGYPFVSLVTVSEPLAASYAAFVERLTGARKVFHKNQRDAAFNLAVFMESAQALAAVMYYDGCLALPRKVARARTMQEWVRPVGMRRVARKQIWSSDEDRYISTHSLAESVTALGRTERSIRMRLWRLRSGQATASPPREATR